MQPTVYRRLCDVALQLFVEEFPETISNSDSNESSDNEAPQNLTQFISVALETPDIIQNDRLCASLLNLQRIIRCSDSDDASSCRKLFMTVDQHAVEAFETTSNFHVKLLSTKLSILSALYLHNFFNHHVVEGQQIITEIRTQLLAHLSSLFAMLVSSPEVKSALADEYERRDVTTSIWLRMRQQTHSEDGIAKIQEVARLQATLESLCRHNLVDHSFDVRNSRGAVVSLRVKHMRGHDGPITALAITPSLLFSGSRDSTIIVWDLATHVQLGRLEGHESEIRGLVVSPEADMLYSACEAGVISSWDLCIMSQTASVQRGHDRPITALALSAGRLFSADDSGVLKAWDACMIGTPGHDELEWPSKQAHTHTITALAATSTRLFSAGTYVKVWDSHSLALLSKVKMHSGLTSALCLHGDILYTGSRAVKVWDAHTLQRTSSPSLKKHAHPVTTIVVSQDGTRLYSAAHVIKEWDLSAGDEAINVLREHTSNVTSLAVSQRVLYSGSLESNDIYYRQIEDTSASGVECVRVDKHSDSIL